MTEGECSVAYEYWMEIEQKTEGSVWTSTGRYWYSDSSKMASLAADKQITQFEAGHHYTYNIVLKTNSGYFISEDTSVSAGGHKFDKVAFKANLEIREMSTELRIYSPYSIDLPAASTDEVITTGDTNFVNVVDSCRKRSYRHNGQRHAEYEQDTQQLPAVSFLILHNDSSIF